MGARGPRPQRTTLYAATSYDPEAQKVVNAFKRDAEAIERWMRNQKSQGKTITFFAKYKLKEVVIDGSRQSSTAG